ncbi:hypothetical protein OPIT5_01935 [Opitutaceae bacterium TAV5]|nr:hypothetical protein OPIT5_01935 [Opitutaceae bacterium TAV5]
MHSTLRFRLFILSTLMTTLLHAAGDDPLKTQLEVADGTPGPSAPDAWRILFVGDSITRHGVNDWTRQNLGWNHLAGMAASAADKDYVHLLAARIQATMPGRKVEIWYDSQVTTRVAHDFKGGSFADKHARLSQTLRKDFRPHLVVIQLGEHEEQKRGKAFMQEHCARLYQFFTTLDPSPAIISTGVWLPGDKTRGRNDYASGWGAAVENTMRTTCEKLGIPFASVRDYALDPACRGSGSSAGVKWHPNDQGMAGYAQVLFEAFGKTGSASHASR